MSFSAIVGGLAIFTYCAAIFTNNSGLATLALGLTIYGIAQTGGII